MGSATRCGRAPKRKRLVVGQARHEDADDELDALRILLHLQVVLDPGGGEAGGQAPIDELGPGEDLVDLLQLGGIEQLGDGQEHGGGSGWVSPQRTTLGAGLW